LESKPIRIPATLRGDDRLDRADTTFFVDVVVRVLPGLLLGRAQKPVRVLSAGEIEQKLASHQVMESDVEGLIVTGRCERTTWRDGYRDRTLDTRLGTLQLRISKLRQGSYY
jgi:hypothetical protein